MWIVIHVQYDKLFVVWLVDQSCWRGSLFGLILKPFFALPKSACGGLVRRVRHFVQPCSMSSLYWQSNTWSITTMTAGNDNKNPITLMYPLHNTKPVNNHWKKSLFFVHDKVGCKVANSLFSITITTSWNDNQYYDEFSMPLCNILW